MPRKTAQLIVEADGTTRHLVDPVSERFGAKIGPKITTRRASHVESWVDLSDKAKARIEDERGWVMAATGRLEPNLFWADMSPVDGPVLGPFSTYEHAITAEIRWLQQHDLPVPQDAPEENNAKRPV